MDKKKEIANKEMKLAGRATFKYTVGLVVSKGRDHIYIASGTLIG